MYLLTMKEMWNYFEELYLGKYNFSRVFDIIEEIFWSEKGTKCCLNVRLQQRMLFLILQDVKM